MKEEIIIKVLDKASAFLNQENIQELRNILEEELYNCTISPTCTALSVINDMPGRVMLFLAAKKLDGCSKITIENYARILQKFCGVVHKDVEQIDSMDIRRYLALYSKSGVKNSTLATIISCLKSFFGWLENEEYITKSPMRKIKNIKVEKRVRKALTREELEMLRDACRSLREKALVEFFYSTGCRLDEVQKLNIADVDWNSGKAMVIGKGDKERPVYLNARAILHLTKYLTSRSDNNTALFVGSRKPHERLGRRAIERTFTSLGELAGISKAVYPHLLRHTTASTMLQNGASLAEVQHYLGHDSPTTTQIYAEMDTQTIKMSHLKHVI
mgnify:CR=1 FL=1|jgi:integrase/recombinase XerD